MTPRDEAKISQLNAKIEKTEEEIKKLEAMKANYQSQKNTILQNVYKLILKKQYKPCLMERK